jgi:hypothetical protein
VTTAKDLIKALSAEYARERSFLDALPSASRSNHGTPDAWSALDLQGHITAWKHQALLRLREDPSAVVEESEEDTDRSNAVFFDSFAGRSWEDILNDSEATHQELTAALGALDEADLAQSDRYPWQDGQALWRRLAGTILIHPWMHLAEHALERGDGRAAVAEADAMLDHLSSLAELPSWIGVLYYNAACLSARAGQADKALSLLRQGLETRPDLVEWSKQDADLESLHSDDRLAQLYASLES